MKKLLKLKKHQVAEKTNCTIKWVRQVKGIGKGVSSSMKTSFCPYFTKFGGVKYLQICNTHIDIRKRWWMTSCTTNPELLTYDFVVHCMELITSGNIRKVAMREESSLQQKSRSCQNASLASIFPSSSVRHKSTAKDIQKSGLLALLKISREWIKWCKWK